MFSVVIPLYNKELSIANTINSVLNQANQSFEIIVIDDGSTDNSVERVRGIQDPRIRLVQQKNQGVSAARNLGIEEARYEWIALLDGDDLWEVNHLEEIEKMMQKFPGEKVYVTSFEYSDGRGTFKHERQTPIFKVENYFKEAVKESLMWTSVVVVNKGCFNKVGCFNININRGEDLDLWVRLAREYEIIKSVKITAIYNTEDLLSLTKSKSNYNQSILSIIDLDNKKNHERVYLKRILFRRIKLDIKTLDFNDLAKILIKHNFNLLR